jgi:hypothetical protein
MKRTITFLFFILSSLIINAQEIISSNGKIKVIFNLPDKNGAHNLSFKVLYKIDSKLGINRTDEQFTDNLNFVAASKPVSIHDKYKMVCGKRQLCENSGTEKTFSFQNSNQQPMNIVFRVYNDGVAFRYVFPNQSDSKVDIVNEATTYVLPDNTSCWMQPYDISYEKFFPLNKTDSANKGQEWGFPALYKVNNQPVWALISEYNSQ